MAIQVVGFRDSGKRVSLTTASSIRDIFANPRALIAQIPLPEQYGVKYSLFAKNTQEFIPFRINRVLPEHIDQVLKIACQALGVDQDKILSQRTGNSLELLVQLSTTIDEHEYTNGYFDSRKIAYESLLIKIVSDLIDNKLSGEPDAEIFSRDQYMSMPGVIFSRASSERTFIINNTCEPVDFDVFSIQKKVFPDSSYDFDKALELVSLNQYSEVEPIKTKATGFRHVDEKGKLGKINVHDLMAQFELDYKFKTLDKGAPIYVYGKTHWETIEKAELENYVTRLTTGSNSRDRSEFVALLRCSNLVTREWFSESTFKKINFKNGILDLKTKKFIEHSEEQGLKHGFLYTLPYDYDASATCPTFDKHLEEVTQGDKSLQNILLEYMGYAISNDEPWAQKCLVLSGTGNNGKSTFINVMNSLVGPQSVSKIKIDQMSNPVLLAGIEGKLFNLADENPEKLYKSNTFKNIVTGGHEIIRHHYIQPYDIQVRAKLIIICNELPHSRDTTDGFFRRFLIVPFDRKFTAEDQDSLMPKKLEAEKSGILNRVIEHYEILCKNRKFTSSEKSANVIREYMESNDSVRDWLVNCDYRFTKDENDFVLTCDMYESYKNYCLSQGADLRSCKALMSSLKSIDARFKTFGNSQKRIRDKVGRGITNLKIDYPIDTRSNPLFDNFRN